MEEEHTEEESLYARAIDADAQSIATVEEEESLPSPSLSERTTTRDVADFDDQFSADRSPPQEAVSESVLERGTWVAPSRNWGGKTKKKNGK